MDKFLRLEYPAWFDQLDRLDRSESSSLSLNNSKSSENSNNSSLLELDPAVWIDQSNDCLPYFESVLEVSSQTNEVRIMITKLQVRIGFLFIQKIDCLCF